VPTHGWQILFTIGGVVPHLVALVCWLALPESIARTCYDRVAGRLGAAVADALTDEDMLRSTTSLV